MKKLFTLLFIFFTFFINASDLLVYSGATFPNFSSISTAIDSSNDGDRILVSSGNYIGDLNFSHKSISVIPMTSNDNYTIQGNIIFNQNISSNFLKVITISSAQVIGNIFSNGNLITPYIFNIISCEMLGRIDLNVDDISTNLYYSKFYNSILLNHSSEIIGNNMFSSSSYRDTLLVENGLFNIPVQSVSSDLKIYANKIDEYLIKCDLAQGSHVINLNFSNNYILADRNYGFSLLYLDGPSTNCVIENNSIQKNIYGGNYAYGHIIYNYGMLTIEINNNLFLQTAYSGSSAAFFYNLGQSTIWNLNNNFFNLYLNNNSAGLFRSNTNPNVFFESNNIYDPTFANFSTSINSTNLNDSSGIPLTNLLTVTENLGLDIIDCRDIDDTQNDIGTWGGPHSWANYHTPSIGKGKIIDLNLISTFGISSNSLLNIRSKAVITK